MPNKRTGFTLIEILVVVLIIGITLGFALLSFGDFGEKRRLLISADQFVNYLKFAQHQAILESSTLGIKIQKTSYHLLRFQPPAQWLKMPNKSIYREQHFPEHVTATLETTSNSPQIIINAEGEIPPFKLHLSLNNEDSSLQVIGWPDGTLQVLSAP